MIKFKDGKNGKIFKDLYKERLINDGIVEVAINKNAWSSMKVIKQWKEKVYIIYFKKYNLSHSLFVQKLLINLKIKISFIL